MGLWVAGSVLYLSFMYSFLSYLCIYSGLYVTRHMAQGGRKNMAHLLIALPFTMVDTSTVGSLHFARVR